MIVPAIEKKEKVINSSKNKLLGFEGFIFCILWEFPASYHSVGVSSFLS